MDIHIMDSFAPTNQSEIEEFEKLMGAVFPEDYRAFLLAHNGGRVKPNGFRYANTPGCSKYDVSYLTEKHELKYLLGIYDNRLDSRSLIQGLELSRRRLPSALTSIGITPNGDMVCISLRDFDFGTVYLWSHSVVLDEESIEECLSIYFIADNFTAFLSGLIDLE